MPKKTLIEYALEKYQNYKETTSFIDVKERVIDRKYDKPLYFFDFCIVRRGNTDSNDHAKYFSYIPIRDNGRDFVRKFEETCKDMVKLIGYKDAALIGKKTDFEIALVVPYIKGMHHYVCNYISKPPFNSMVRSTLKVYTFIEESGRLLTLDEWGIELSGRSNGLISKNDIFLSSSNPTKELIIRMN